MIAFYFIFVAGHFVGNYKAQIERMSINTGTNGSTVEISELLLYADQVKGGKLGLNDMKNKILA